VGSEWIWRSQTRYRVILSETWVRLGERGERDRSVAQREESLFSQKRSLGITGHTDSAGDAAYNEELSMNRASAIKEALVERGIDAARLETLGTVTERVPS
jgi:hypothetical protein